MLETKTNENSQNGLELDIRAFELEIEKEIDSLFIPVGSEGEIKVQSEPPSLEIEEPRAPAPHAPTAEPVILEASTGEAETVRESFEEAPVRGPAVSEAAPATPVETEELTLVLESPDDSSHELEQLIEMFQASYLSFDWDFSPPNVSDLADVLTKLEPHCLKMPETESLYKIMKAALQRIAARPETVSPELVEVVREAQGLLKRFLLIGKTGISSGDRADLKALISRVHAIRNAQLQRESRPYNAVAASPAGVVTEYFPSGESAVGGSWSGFEGDADEVGRWIERAGLQVKSTLQGLQDVNRRLLQLEQILVSKPALAPLTSRIKSLRLSLEQQVTNLTSQESFWSRLSALASEKGLQFKGSTPGDGTGPAEGKPSGQGSPSQSTTAAAAASSNRRTQHEQVCLITLGGRRYAVLSANVVKVQPVNGKKVTQISKRGYGLLKDFKPFLRGIKSGLFGTWIGIPTNVLKAYQFMPVTFNGLNIEPPEPDEVKGAVLVSNGKQHGIIWSESGSVDLMTETIELTPESSPILGRIHLDRGEEVEVLHVDHLLESTHRQEVRD